MSHEDDFQKLIDAIWAERDQGRGVRRALAEHPDLWPLVVQLGLQEFAVEAEDDGVGDLAEEVAHGDAQAVAGDDDGDQTANDEDPAFAVCLLGTPRRGAGVPTPGFKPPGGRRTFAGSVVKSPGVVAWSGRAAIG